MEKKAFEAIGDLSEDEELGPTDWPAVKSYIKSIDNISGEHVHPHYPSESFENWVYLDLMNLKDMRIRLLNGIEIFPPLVIPLDDKDTVSLAITKNPKWDI